ncbi:MAG: 23S rRNA pseudouridine(1911/1915/1917) synthase RluD [Gammaproteobacteria bacterium]|nr:MAG: 23S rRNA pseudouridine(1911/1915/1917) synthase RluD [Gammaproteobacteria bacterium]
MTNEGREIHLSAEIGPELAGRRLDQALARLFDDYSRSRLQAWIREGRVTLNGRPAAQRDKVAEGDRVALQAEEQDRVECLPQEIPLDIVYEDEHLLVIDKPAGLVVHPAAGNPDGTVQNALLYHDGTLARLPRAGIVHRLDKDTTGLMVVARTSLAYQRLVSALAARQIHREYRALVVGRVASGATIEQPIGRHPTVRTRMAVNPLGKPAVTHYRVLERFASHTLLGVQLESGRTHQIRVHMAHIRHPVFGDPVYGGRLQLPAGADESLKTLMRRFRRQALHARRLILQHPVSGREMRFDAAIPPDMAELLEALRAHAGERAGEAAIDEAAFLAALGDQGWEIDEDD